jgi:hypothetical protein
LAVWGDFSYSPVRSNDALMWEAAAVQACVDHGSADETRRKLNEEARRRHPLCCSNPSEESYAQREEALAVLRAHPGQALRLYPLSVLRLLLSPGLDIVAEDLWPGASGPHAESPAYSLAGRGTFSTLKARPPLWAVLAWGLLVLAALYGLAALSLRRLWQKRERFIIAACLVPVAYLTIVSSGGWAYYRYRIPILPLLGVVDAIALGELLAARRQRPETRPSSSPAGAD